MKRHGHARTDYRNLALHRAALDKLRLQPQLLSRVLALLEKWLADDALKDSRPYLRQWHDMLTKWPFERMAEFVLHPENGQAIRQCSPLGPALTPRERWSIFKQADAEARLLEL